MNTQLPELPEGSMYYTDYDSPWKNILESYFREFMDFFFPTASAGIDWAYDYEFLDKELQQIVRDAELGRRLVDKLVKVFTSEGDEAWVVVHVEVQGKQETEFAKRMYVYNYRLFDRYDRHVVSLAVLADDRHAWRPNHFSYKRWGCEISLTFPVVKLLDYAGSEEELYASSNPFAVVVLAHLKTQATRKHPEDRFQWKLHLFKRLYKQGYSRAQILELMCFIDWLMVLPEPLEKRFEDTMRDYEEEKTMRYITTFERRAIQEGRQEGRQEGIIERSREDILDILQVRFEWIPDSLVGAVNALDDLTQLRQLHRQAVTIGSVDEFMALLDRQAVPA